MNSQRAEDDLEDLTDHIAQDNLEAALAVRDEIERQIENLKEFPDMGRPGRVKVTRELVVAGTPYIVIYKVDATGTIEIVRVLHGAPQWPPSVA